MILFLQKYGLQNYKLFSITRNLSTINYASKATE